MAHFCLLCLELSILCMSLDKQMNICKNRGTVQTSHNLNGTREQNAKHKKRIDTRANAKIKFCVCLCVLF